MFLLFAGHTYYPYGGWEDFKGTYPSKEEAEKAADKLNLSWWHVVDLTKQEIVASSCTNLRGDIK